MAELGEIGLEGLAEVTQGALLRLHLAVTGETHRMLGEYGEAVRRSLLERADEEGMVDVVRGMGVMGEAARAWEEFFRAWQEMFEKARWVAGALAFGRLARMHQGMMGGEMEEGYGGVGVREYGGVGVWEEQVGEASPVFEPQLQGVLDAAAARVYDDGFNLSGRLWRLDRDSWGGIQRTLLGGIAEGDSAWNIAKRAEEYLGAGADCPRWTSTRLRLTKKEIAAGDRRGLYSSTKRTPCASKGVAYNALRMARNEIQIVHHMTTDETFGRVPWIEQEQIVLSPDHPDIGCECEEVVIGGEEGDGVYPKREILLPIHVQCLCFKVAVLMEAEAFVGRLGDWMRGTATWPEMDGYADYLGVERGRVMEPGLLVSWGRTLVTWAWGNEEALRGALGLGG